MLGQSLSCGQEAAAASGIGMDDITEAELKVGVIFGDPDGVEWETVHTINGSEGWWAGSTVIAL